MDEGVALLESEVRELVRRRGVDPARDADGVRALVSAALADYDDRSVAGLVPPIGDPEAAAKEVVDAVAGLGPLQRYLDDPEIEEIWINELRASVIRVLLRIWGGVGSPGPQGVRTVREHLSQY